MPYNAPQCWAFAAPGRGREGRRDLVSTDSCAPAQRNAAARPRVASRFSPFLIWQHSHVSLLSFVGHHHSPCLPCAQGVWMRAPAVCSHASQITLVRADMPCDYHAEIRLVPYASKLLTVWANAEQSSHTRPLAAACHIRTKGMRTRSQTPSQSSAAGRASMYIATGLPGVDCPR